MHRLDPVRGDQAKSVLRRRRRIVNEIEDTREMLLEDKRVNVDDFIGRRVVKFENGRFSPASFRGSQYYTRREITRAKERVRALKLVEERERRSVGYGTRLRFRLGREMAHIVETVLILGAPQIFGPNTEFVVPSEADDWVNGIDLLLVIMDDNGRPIQIIALDFTAATRVSRQERKFTRTIRGIVRNTLSTASFVTLPRKFGGERYFTARGIPRLTFGLSEAAALQIGARVADNEHLALEYSADCADAVGSMFVQLQAQQQLAERHGRNKAARQLSDALGNMEKYIGRPKLRHWKVANVIESINEFCEPASMDRLYAQAVADVARIKRKNEDEASTE